jgi:hypothetical protein
MKEDMMDRICSTYVLEVRTIFGMETSREVVTCARRRRRAEDNLGMALRVIRVGLCGLTHAARGRDQWRALVNNSEPSGFIKVWEFLD